MEEIDVRRDQGSAVMTTLRNAFNVEMQQRYPDAHADYGPQTLPQGMFRPTGGFYVLYDNDEPVGCVGLRKLPSAFAHNMNLSAYEAGRSCEGKSLYIDPKVRNGFGASFLMRALVEGAIQLGYDWLYGNTGRNQPESLRVLHSFHRLRGYSTLKTEDIPLYDPGNALAAYAVRIDLRDLVI